MNALVLGQSNKKAEHAECTLLRRRNVKMKYNERSPSCETNSRLMLHVTFAMLLFSLFSCVCLGMVQYSVYVQVYIYLWSPYLVICGSEVSFLGGDLIYLCSWIQVPWGKKRLFCDRSRAAEEDSSPSSTQRGMLESGCPISIQCPSKAFLASCVYLVVSPNSFKRSWGGSSIAGITTCN